MNQGAGLLKKIPFEIVLFLLAAFLRLRHLGKQSLWIDEAFSVWTAAHPLRFILQILKSDAHPPLFYTLLHGWLHYGHSEAFLRLPFTLFGAVNAILVYRLGKLSFNQKTAVAASLFWAVSFPMLDAETQIRMYAMATTFSLLATLFFLQAFRQPSFSRWLLYFLAASLCLYTHYYTVFLLAAHLLFLILHKRIREFTWLSLALTAVFLPWSLSFLEQFSGQFHGRPEIGATEKLAFSEFLGTYWFFQNDKYNLAITLAGLLFILGSIVVIFREGKKETQLIPLILCIMFLLPFEISLETPLKIFLFRFAVLFAPYFYLILFFGLLKIRSSVIFPVFAGLIFVNLSLWTLMITKPAYERENWRGAAQLVRARLQPGDILFVEYMSGIFPLWYYLPDKFRIVYFPETKELDTISFQKGVQWVLIGRRMQLKILKPMWANRKREWLILSQEGTIDPKDELVRWFFAHREPVFFSRFRSFPSAGNISVFLFQSPTAKKGNDKS